MNLSNACHVNIEQSQLALLPAVLTSGKAALVTALEGGTDLLEFILSQDLGPLWHYSLQSNDALESLPTSVVEPLSTARRIAAFGYMQQRIAIEQLDQLFATEGIQYVVIKGGHVRECVYPDPALRLASDIDILIFPNDKSQVAKILFNAGYSVDIDLNNISHEATFSRGLVQIDLHWDILRPGRTRMNMTEGFLTRRQRFKGFWALSNRDTLFLMLTHSAFVKYVCSPNMGLGRVADFLLWMQQMKAEWPEVIQLLEAAGLKTAAWMMLSWFQRVAQPDLATQMNPWLETIKPGRLRTAYLRYWLEHNLPDRWLQKPFLIQVGLTLFLHDRLADTLHALHGMLKAKQNRLQDAHQLLGENIPLSISSL